MRAQIEMVLPESLPVRNPIERQASLNPVLPLIEPRESSTLRWLALVTFLTALPESGEAEIAMLYMDDALALEGEAAREFASAYYALTGVGLIVSQTVFLRYLPRLVDGPIAMLLVSATSNMLHMLVCVVSLLASLLATRLTRARARSHRYTLVGVFHAKPLAFSNIVITSVRACSCFF